MAVGREQGAEMGHEVTEVAAGWMGQDPLEVGIYSKLWKVI